MCARDDPKSLVNQTEVVLAFIIGLSPFCYNLGLVWKLKYFKLFVNERKCVQSQLTLSYTPASSCSDNTCFDCNETCRICQKSHRSQSFLLQGVGALD